MVNNPLEKLNKAEQERFLSLIKEKHDKEQYDKFHTYFFQNHKINENGLDISSKNYKKHLLFMQKGKEYREPAFIAPNRVGKSDTGSFEITAHVMKDYPDWWEGKKFPKQQALEILIVGKTNNSLVSTIQKKLLGSLFDIGTGMIPKDRILIDKMTKKPNCPGGIQDLYIKDNYGCINHIQFLSSDVEDDVIMGRELHIVWFDEECLNDALYDEALMRTMTTNGIVFTTFTPMDGLTTAIIRFMPSGKFPEGGIVKNKDGKATGCFTVNCGWNDVPHLTDEWKDDMRKRYHGAQLLARTEGIPAIGSGHVYPIAEQDIVVKSFPIPEYWPRAYGLDFGVRETAAVWVAQDPDTKIMYVYGEYHAGNKIPYIHVQAIKSKGEWIRGAADPSGKRAEGPYGESFMTEFRNLGLDLVSAPSDRLTHIAQVANAFEAGQLKIMSHMQHLLDEYRVYRFDDKGRIAREQDDHELDALRYVFVMFRYIAQSEVDHTMGKYLHFYDDDMYVRDELTGY